MSWNENIGSDRLIVLQISTDPSFHTLQREIALPGQQQVHLSGFANGRYYARMLDQHHRPAGNRVEFEVRHRDLLSAWILFAIGLLLFILLFGCIVRFTNREQ